MSELLKKIKEDLKTAMTIEVRFRKNNDKPTDSILAIKNMARAIISMFPEIGKKPNQATDDDVMGL